jgi:hypothetical protein
MPHSRRTFIRRAGSLSAFAMLAPGGHVEPFFVDASDSADTLQKNLMPSSDEIWKWQVWMAKLGPKYTGNRAHTEFVEWFASNMKSTGLDVSRDRFTLPLWEARRWGIRAAAANGQTLSIPVTGYYPYSGQTDKDGVTGPLVLSGNVNGLPRDQKWTVPDASGKIVFADFIHTEMPYEEWWKPWGFYTPDTRFPKMINGTWGIRVPMLGDMKAAGAKGIIFGHRNISDEHVALLYAPFGRANQGIPALWVGQKAGDQLKTIAQNGGAVTLTLEADVTPDTPTDTVIATLPGTSSDEVIIVNTHSDGPNAPEENGPVALVALAKYFAKLPRSSRRRTLVFVSTTGHFAGAYVPSIRGFVQTHPDIISKAVGAVTVEHLGCREWIDNASMKYVASGKDELTLVITEFEATAKVMLDSFEGTGDRRAAVVVPTPRGGFNGEGGALSRAGIPTIGYIPIPSYLLVGPADGCIDKLSKPLLYEQIVALGKAIQKMDGMSAAELKGKGRTTTA